jgi:PAS domain S-box-containing protein
MMGVHPGEPERLEPQERALLETLLLEAPVGFAFYDLQRRWRRINRTLAETNGLPMAAHIGRRPSEMLPPPLGDAIESHLERVLTTGQAFLENDFTAVHPTTGTVRHWQSQWYPARDAAGEVIGVAVVVTDVTERRNGEEALRRSQARTERLMQATSALSSALTMADVTRIISALGRAAVGAESAGVTLAEEPAGVALVAREALRTGRPLYLSSPEELAVLLSDEEVAEVLASAGERAWAAVPMIADGEVYAALRFGWSGERILEPEERMFLEALAGQCALAFGRARLYEREHRTAEALQRSLLPDRLPQVAGVELAATYRPGMEEARVGGDWYDAFALPDGRLAFVVGDVMGKGVVAAAGMGRMRSAVRALAYTDPSPRAVLTGLDRLFSATEVDEQITTLFYAVVDPQTGSVVAGDAGHPPVVHADAAGQARLVDVGGMATPLGLPEERIECTMQLRPGDLLLAYTDGLVERRHRGIDVGMDLLAVEVSRVVRANPRHPVEELVEGLVTALEGPEGHADDVTALGMRWWGTVPPAA